MKPPITHTLAALLCAALLAIPASAAAAQGTDAEAPSRMELREQLLPVYTRLLNDPHFQALRLGLVGNLDNPDAVDRYLRYLPMSPKEMLELEMFVRRFEIAVPRIIQQWHHRWIELHPELARRHYGPDALERRPAPFIDDDAAAAVPGIAGLLLRAASVGANRNLAHAFAIPPNEFQGEIQVVVNPNNPKQLVAAANTWNSIPGTCSGDTQAVFYSSDGGVTWGYTCSPDDSAYPGLSCAGQVFGSDPALFWNDNDEVFLNHMLICFTGAFRYSIVVARSLDGGATWNGQGVVINSWGNNNLEDKNFYAIDNNPGSPFYGRHYTCWDRNNNEKSAYSIDSGQTWTEVDLPPTPSTGSGGAFDLACELEVEDDGTVHVIYDTLRCLANCNNEQMFYSQSTDGGLSWSAPILLQDFNLVGFSGANCPGAQDNRCINPFGAIGVDNSGGDCDGNLYATFSDWTSGGVETTDVWLIRSTDGGSTWSAPLKINNDEGSSIQFHPFLQVDQSNGDVVVAWHDGRNYDDTNRIDFFVARSTNCGVSFEGNVQASKPTDEFNNNTISWSNMNTVANPGANPNQYGEYLGLDVLDGRAYIAWTDTRHYFPLFPAEPQDENVGFVAVTFCDDGKGRGEWNLPVSGATGGAKGTLYDASTVPSYTIKVSLVETIPGQGTLSGKLYGLGANPDYDVRGRWSINTPPGTGTFGADIFELGTTQVKGAVSGGFRDDPLSSIVGAFEAEWKLCP